MKELEKTESVCPECFKEGKVKVIPATIIERNNQVWIRKECIRHGPFEDLFFGDVGLYKRWMKYKVTGERAPEIKTHLFDDYYLYDMHRSQTVLTNLMATNRCNLRCSYCFMNAGASGYVYEPSLAQIRELLKQARNQKPIGSKALQITGGEPTIRDDLFDIIEIAKELGFSHIQLNTNGIKLAEDIDYCRRIRESGINTIYMSFDGVSEGTNPWLKQNKKAIENLREVKQMMTLVPVLDGSNNIQEAGKIIKFALENLDIVRAVNFQPISFCGRMTSIKNEERKKRRVDYARMMEAIEREFSGKISRDDFYPVPFVFPVSKIIEKITGRPEVEFTAHPGCGGATYIFLKDGDPVPVTRFIDVEGLINFVNQQSQKKGILKKVRIGAAFLKEINNYVYQDKAPDNFDLKRILKEAVLGGSYDSLRDFHYNSLFVGSMWFQDVWNLNIERLKRCVIHYTTLEGMIPFCSYNGLDWGEKIRKKHSIPVKEWERRTNKKMKEDLWKGGKIA
jgi:7,8-dihydro-6-hydroxymethylpterin dimethyltransferase